MTNMPAAKAPASAAKADATFKVGLVTDIGGLNDRGFNQLANQGLQRAIKQLKVKVQAQIMDNKLRVTGKKLDDLQVVIAHLKAHGPEYPLQFVNFT